MDAFGIFPHGPGQTLTGLPAHWWCPVAKFLVTKRPVCASRYRRCVLASGVAVGSAFLIFLSFVAFLAIAFPPCRSPVESVGFARN